ncbi:MAG TPA: IPT/TIG domain-containing protein [Bryobacteraceae bacterium]|nr:IPT/TIG domain-containing protein [Bryobacteraceae bacterium]
MIKTLLLSGALALTLQAQVVTVTATPSSVTFAYQIGTVALPAAQTVTVKASSGTPAFTATSPGIDAWLTVTPAAGHVPGSLTVRVNPTSLTAKTYSSTVTLTVTGVAPVTIPVTLVVTPAPSTLMLSTTTLNFTTPPNPPASQTITMTTNGAPISFTVTSGATWLTATTLKGVGAPDVVTPGEEYPLVLSVDSTGLTPQAAPYVGKVTVVASGAVVTAKSQTITVNLTVNSSTPTITSVWPASLPVNGPAQIITVYGTNFYSATVVKVKGVAMSLVTTTFKDSSTFVQAVVPATMLTAPTTLQVLVSNPAPGGDSVAMINVVVANAAVIAAVVNAASYATGTVTAPDLGTVSRGELVTIFGTNLGPTTPAPMSITVGGFVDTVSASGVSVTVDGTAAPLIYVSEKQISVQVPYEAAIGTGKVVSVTNGANPPVTATVTVGASAPGLFTADGSGAGGLAALNYNATTHLYTLNSSTNLAKIGDTVILYLTGEGVYDSAPLLGGASDTGFVIPPGLPSTPQLSPLPTVSIGGVDATPGVAYAGPIVGSIIGVIQINVVVPVGSTTGTQVPVTVTIGGHTTQAGTTLAIHP